jgi:hypothetical protein
VLVLDWHGHHEQERSAAAGEDPRRVTEAIT